AYITEQQIHNLQSDLRSANADVNALRDGSAQLRQNAMPREDGEKLRSQVLEDLMYAKKELAGQADRIKLVESLVHTEVDKLEKPRGETPRNELTALARHFEKLGEDFRAQAASYDALKGSLSSIESSITQLRSDLEAVKALKEKAAAVSTQGSESGPSEP